MRALKAATRLIAFLCLLGSVSALAGPRADHWSGFDLALGEPFPSIVGLNVGFNIGDDVRLTPGVGSFGKWVTYALDSKYFASADQWAGYFGVGLTYMVGDHGRYLAWDLDFDHAFIPYFELGMDFQSDMGVHVGFNIAGSAPGGTILILPSIALGWYF